LDLSVLERVGYQEQNWLSVQPTVGFLVEHSIKR
jgi:hypothetical protein